MSSLKVFISSSLPSESSGPNSSIKQLTENVNFTIQRCWLNLDWLQIGSVDTHTLKHSFSFASSVALGMAVGYSTGLVQTDILHLNNYWTDCWLWWSHGTSSSTTSMSKFVLNLWNISAFTRWIVMKFGHGFQRMNLADFGDSEFITTRSWVMGLDNSWMNGH